MEEMSENTEAHDVPNVADIIIPDSLSEELEFVSNEDPSGFTEHYSRRKIDNAKQGSYTKVSSEGKLIEQTTYVNDTIDGIRVLYTEKGDTQIVESYVMGQFNGPFKAFYENGNLELLGHYETNIMKGKWYKYYDTGELMEIVTFDNNLENGPFVEFYKNGNKKAEGNYENGDNENGLLLLYDEEGILVKKMECDIGICKTIWRFGQEEI